jgi:hypothetical protein
VILTPLIYSDKIIPSMEGKKCESCSLRGVCRESTASWIFFMVGLIATIAMRIIEPLNVFSPVYGKISWYVGVLGFTLFFLYKYRVLLGQNRIILETGLKEKLSSHGNLSDGDFALLSQILCSQYNWKERVNFIAIFSLSALALALALYTDLT